MKNYCCIEYAHLENPPAVAIALTHGAVAFEVAKQEFHGSSSVESNDDMYPCALRLVLTQHHGLDVANHGNLVRRADIVEAHAFIKELTATVDRKDQEIAALKAQLLQRNAAKKRTKQHNHSLTTLPARPSNFTHVKCSECSRMFLKRNLKRHQDEEHGDLHPLIPCPNCGKWFKRKHYMEQHQKTHGEYYLTCDQCGKNFQSKEKLSRHKKVTKCTH